LLELIKLDNTIRLDIRYARHDNFVGRPVYKEARAFLRQDAARALVRVHRSIRSDGLGLVIFDAYRPWSVTKLFWDVVLPEQRIYVADPDVGSRHNRGSAVDLSLFSLSTHELLDMPSDFDEFNQKAHPGYSGGTSLQRRNREYLRSAMESECFEVNPNEWWHFDHVDWSKYEILDLPFEELQMTDRPT
jgi:D-alanyl-D-alanine dipeptidase